MNAESIMKLRKVTAIIRGNMLEKVETALQEADVHACTVSTVTGFGEYANFYAKDHMTEHARLEIFIEQNRAEEIARIIMEAAHVGLPGDGIVAILPVEKLFSIRTRSEATPEPMNDQSE
jgi:nitrogen regulatory protein P-II 1